MNTEKQKIFVGISGGVDSSVAAYLLKKEGHEVHGVFIKTWSPEWVPCTWVDEKRDAMRVCAALDIPFHFLDAEAAYKDGVADYMIDEYRAGRTPNPDVLCNRVIKFGVLWDYAKEEGADAIATGHYAQTDGVRLLRGADTSKDQSYFLWMLTKEELAHIRFPIGRLQKSEVRSIAERAGLFTAVKKDSQGVCFLGDVDMREFLSYYIEEKKGAVVDERGAVIGEHDGVWFYTIGERHGFTITAAGAAKVPHYVVGKEVEKNILVVSPRSPVAVSLEKTKKEHTEVLLRSPNWITAADKQHSYKVQIRYHGTPLTAKLHTDDKIEICSDGALPLGQSLVVYDDTGVLVGGGIIDGVSPLSKK